MDLRQRHLHPDNRLYAEHAITLITRLLVAGLLLLAGALTAGAQTSVEVSPLRVDLKMAPGQATTQAVTVTNRGQEAVRIRATLSDWHLTKEGTPQFEDPLDGRKYAATAWVRIAPPELVLEPRQEGIVRFSLSVPTGADHAGYRTGVIFDFSPANVNPLAQTAKTVSVRNRIATLIYAHVGTPPLSVDLTDLRSRVAPEQTTVFATLKNTSARSVRTKGTLRLLDANGKMVREIAVPDVPVLPESERDVAITIPAGASPLAEGEYRVEVRIDVGLPAVIVGETTLKVVK
jgi:P pilus assembly chaperone PapD